MDAGDAVAAAEAALPPGMGLIEARAGRRPGQVSAEDIARLWRAVLELKARIDALEASAAAARERVTGGAP